MLAKELAEVHSSGNMSEEGINRRQKTSKRNWKEEKRGMMQLTLLSH